MVPGCNPQCTSLCLQGGGMVVGCNPQCASLCLQGKGYGSRV